MNLTQLQNEVIQLVNQRRENRKLKNRIRRILVRFKNKMTNAKHLPQIDSVYVYNLNLPVPFTHREQPEEGYRFKNRNVLMRSRENEIHIYHQSIEINGIIKGITMVTMDKDQKRVKKLFAGVNKIVSGDPDRLAVFNNAGKPVQLDILHIY